jgi:hypothetical protein
MTKIAAPLAPATQVNMHDGASRAIRMDPRLRGEDGEVMVGRQPGPAGALRV